MDQNNSLDKQIKQAELEKLVAEKERIRSEQLKIDIERRQLDKPAIDYFGLLKAIVAGFVGGIAILGVFQSVIEPTYKKDIIKQELEVAKREKVIFHLSDSIQTSLKRIKSLTNENRVVLKQIEKAKRRNLDLLDSLQDFEVELNVTKENVLNQRKRTVEILRDQAEYIKGLNRDNAIHVQSIYFEFDKLAIPDNQLEGLNSVVKFLIENKTDSFILQVDGYSYWKGTADYNLKISERRARNVAEYLIANRIPANRIKYRGFGEHKAHPLIVNDLDPEVQSQLRELKSVVQIYLTY